MSDALAALSQVDGIPLLRGKPVDGRCLGGLFFRVGQADETLSTRGITHLVEHLALSATDPTKVHSNGATGNNITQFHVSGSADEVRDFLNHVAAGLRGLPVQRLATEVGILRTEEAGRAHGAAPMLPMWRHGAQGYGLTSFDEFGLHRVGEEDVLNWAGTWFTRGNCVLWLAVDELPIGLDLRLPDGPRQPLPEPTSALPRTPAYYTGPAGVVVAEALVPRSTPASVYSSVLEQSLYRDLRQEGGYSYRIATNYEPLDRDTASIAAMADALPDKQSTLVSRFLATFASLRDDDAPEEMIASAIEKRREMLAHPDSATMALPSSAVQILYGGEPVSHELLRAELDAVDAASIRAVARQAFTSTLLQTPTTDAELGEIVAAPTASQVRVGGTRHALDDRTTIVLGEEGISRETADSVATVLWTDVVACLSYPDGRRDVVGRDGFFVSVDPRRLPVKGATLAPAIDRRVAPSLVVPMPARKAEPPQTGSPRRVAWWVWLLALLSLTVLVGIAIVMAVAAHFAPGAALIGVVGIRLLLYGYRRLSAQGSL